jgi:glycosyltransferase involved in cell wall biosynthesis
VARIALADDGSAFDGRSADAGALGGAETAFVRLAEALATRGHEVRAYTAGGESIRHKDVDWAPLAEFADEAPDLYVANRGHRLLDLARGARRTVFWLHNDAAYLRKWRYLKPLLLRRPTLVFVSESHRARAPFWLPGGAKIAIPLGLEDAYRHDPERAPPPPVALYAANPLRGLAELAAWWPEIGGKLIAHSGADLYKVKPRTRDAMEQALSAARAVPGIELRPFVSRAQLIDILRHARAFLYPGDPTETFCLSVAEAQALGVPCVVMARGALPERVRDGETGFVAKTRSDFIAAARHLMSDDALWRRLHRTCLATQRARGWHDMAADFERLLA